MITSVYSRTEPHPSGRVVIGEIRRLGVWPEWVMLPVSPTVANELVIVPEWTPIQPPTVTVSTSSTVIVVKRSKRKLKQHRISGGKVRRG